MSQFLHQRNSLTTSALAARPEGHRSVRRRIGFTLVELLVVIGIIALLISILLPALAKAQHAAKQIKCAANLHQIGIGIQGYANDNNGCIPYGPWSDGGGGDPFGQNLYLWSGDVTNLIQLDPQAISDNPLYTSGGQPAPTDGVLCGLGLLLPNQLGDTPQVFFCPDVDQDSIADVQISYLTAPNQSGGHGTDVQSDYIYRHAGLYALGNAPTDDGSGRLRLANLGLNGQDNSSGYSPASVLGAIPIKALAMDFNFYWVYDTGISPNIFQHTTHNQESVNILYSDGHVQSEKNPNSAPGGVLDSGNNNAPLIGGAGPYSVNGEDNNLVATMGPGRYTTDADGNTGKPNSILDVFEMADQLDN